MHPLKDSCKPLTLQKLFLTTKPTNDQKKFSARGAAGRSRVKLNQRTSGRQNKQLAEGVGFEPTVALRLRLISSQVPSTTQPPFLPQKLCAFLRSRQVHLRIPRQGVQLDTVLNFKPELGISPLPGQARRAVLRWRRRRPQRRAVVPPAQLLRTGSSCTAPRMTSRLPQNYRPPPLPEPSDSTHI